MSTLRALMVLGRVSNLPTVWSNCLAGWWLGGDGNREKLPFLFVGATLLYLGGMFLNDAFDVEFDRLHRKDRPIPSGAIGLRTVWSCGLVLLAAGVVILFWPGIVAGSLGLALAGCIVLYDSIHKRTSLAPMLMGLCRLLLYLVAAATAIHGVTGWAIWCGLALCSYIIGLSYLARQETADTPLPCWPIFFLATPIILGVIMNARGFREHAFLLAAVLGLWVVRCLRQTLWATERNVGATISGLLAGIVFVDWLAVVDAGRELGFIFIPLFLLALLLQRLVPAT